MSGEATKFVPEGGESIEEENAKREAEEYKKNRGYLAPALDPVGNVAQKGLSPVGAVVGTIAKPVTDTVGSITKPVLGPVLGRKEDKMEVLGGDNKDSWEHGKDSLGGREQDAENPLGLDQTGKFGFREEKK